MNTKQMADVLVNNVIDFKVKNVYGRENIYIVSEHAEYIESLTRRKTIDSSDMKALELLGFVFRQVL